LSHRALEREILRIKVGEAIRKGEFIKNLEMSQQKLPPPSSVKMLLEDKFKICSDRRFRIILVEDFDEYKVFIQIPDGKSECDFYVWYAKFSNNVLIEWNIPTHDYLGKWYNELKDSSEDLEEYMINAVLRLIRDRESVFNIVERYFLSLQKRLKLEVAKFLSTLKWVALEEDVNYPPPKYLGSKCTLAVYALLEAGFTMSDIRRIVKF
jgi:hypothetical protein